MLIKVVKNVDDLELFVKLLKYNDLTLFTIYKMINIHTVLNKTDLNLNGLSNLLNITRQSLSPKLYILQDENFIVLNKNGILIKELKKSDKIAQKKRKEFKIL